MDQVLPGRGLGDQADAVGRSGLFRVSNTRYTYDVADQGREADYERVEHPPRPRLGRADGTT